MPTKLIITIIIKIIIITLILVAYPQDLKDSKEVDSITPYSKTKTKTTTTIAKMKIIIITMAFNQ